MNAALIDAMRLCETQGEKWTSPRRRVYERLLTAGRPMKAYDLLPAFAEGRPAKPPTVYRALEFLEHLGLAHRIPSLNAYVACEAGGKDHDAAFLICGCCGAAQEFEPDLSSAIRPAAAMRGFHPAAFTLEVRGLCQRCA